MTRKFDDLRGVPREIPHSGIDLSQRNLHSFSVKAGGEGAKSVVFSFRAQRGICAFRGHGKNQIPRRFASRNDKKVRRDRVLQAMISDQRMA